MSATSNGATKASTARDQKQGRSETVSCHFVPNLERNALKGREACLFCEGDHCHCRSHAEQGVWPRAWWGGMDTASFRDPYSPIRGRFLARTMLTCCFPIRGSHQGNPIGHHSAWHIRTSHLSTWPLATHPRPELNENISDAHTSR